ncbi:MAG: ABC transporter permease [Chloroflexi bacterium]|nr:ABC transporter permease [Chloroflexota bacterium]
MTPGEPLIRWDWVLRNLDAIGQRIIEHIVLTAIAVGVGFIISFALSLLIARRPRLYAPVTWVTGILYTIPSLALFALLIPITGLSIVTAEIGLVSYTLLILIRNIVAGIQGVPADVREAAIGMGYTPMQLLWHVELPLAMAVIIAGVRVASVTTIGLTTVTALIGQGGLGFLILEGIQRFFSTPLIIGAVLSVVLAVLVDGALVLVQRWITPWTRA